MSDDKNYEEICSVCHRNSSVAGKMIHLPGNLTICADCMQKSLETIERMGFPMDPGLLQQMMPGVSGKTDPKSPDRDALESDVVNPDGSPLRQDQLTQGQESEQTADRRSEGSDENPAGNSGEKTPDPKDRPEQNTGEDRENPNQDPGQEVKTSPNQDPGQNSNNPFAGFPGFGMFNLGDLFNGGMMGMGQGPRIKKRTKPGEKSGADGQKDEDDYPTLNIKDIPAPHKIKEQLDQYVVGQDKAKKMISVAVYNHYKRIASEQENQRELGTPEDLDGVDIEKSNILIIGPTGSGKTYMVRTLARLLDVPLAITDATSLTEAGYIGDDIESVVSKLLAAADNDVDRAEQGIIFVDEIDKLAKKKNTHSRDVSGESVQQGMLKLLEGAEVEVPVGASSKNAMVPMTTVNTRNILFIVGGAFPGLEDIIKERLSKRSSMGFTSELRGDVGKDIHILEKVRSEDLRNFGMIPEFLGRLPIVTAFEQLDEDMFVRILTEPKNAIIKQYQKLLALDEVRLTFSDGAFRAIARKAAEEELGARALRSIIEEYMMDIMYEIPKDPDIGEVEITEDYIEHRGGPRVTMRTVLPQSQEGQD
ncbi:ATP-dependent Clp protease, ATP-binding subunit ClpX [Shuttleworthella satelles DSM 14600]|uniref:ATP-dependent Clp protease, ATP-binding subunit ClpX n=2 Tax=Shuttleworthella TaxID=177971 RepID=C4G8R2_9FIRM|nr:ATP-dependent Clp protease ATP-binding subunit ClpX [Shuttleworthia satelles]EEP29009.1 ATP-dependent Clp protease, ATP-binding subunit ClpX [Shuttleworthia satelles DSM 14600]